MENLSQEQDKKLKRAFSEVGLEKPSPDFISNIISEIELQRTSGIVVKPLISRKGWVLLFSVFAICGSVLGLYPEQGSSLFDMLSSFRTDFLKDIFQGLKISKTMTMGISLLGLFLFQLPFLLKIVNKERAL